jgi:RHS repeat-associated protein
METTALTESGGDPLVTKYYFHGGKRAAMDREGVVQYLATDHLGSTSLVMDDQGSKVAEGRHYPYGGERWRWPQEGTFPTEYRFTGQRSDSGLGLVHMGARFYDSALGRWTSADTLVPEPESPQSFNRYMFVLGNSLRYTDPSGHGACSGDDYDPACEGDDPLYELYTVLGLEGTMDFSIFRANMEVLAELYKAFEDFPIAGIRVEGTLIGLLGVDANLDIVWDWNNFDGDAFFTVGWQLGADVGLGGNVGLLFLGGMDDLDDYMEIGDHAGFTVADDAVLNMFSVEADYGWSEPKEDGERIHSLFVGFLGGGEEVGIWRGSSIKTWRATIDLEWIYHFLNSLQR